MARFPSLALFSLALGGALVTAQEQKHITDVAIYSQLAPCAQYALSGVIDWQTSSCGENNDLQSCVCTKDNNYAAIGTSISKSLSWSCGTTATEDISSASVVYSAYCTPDQTYVFPTPTTNIVSQLVTDMPEFFNLAQCAQRGLSFAAVTALSSVCPTQVELYIPCMCTRNNNKEQVNRIIASSVSWNCDDNGDDITSAQEFFSAYCNMVNGTTNLPVPTNPPGDMSYYITALPEYSALAPCAMRAVSGIVGRQSSSRCPAGPQALASCICIKASIFETVSAEVTSAVKNSCDSTALEDVTSAIGVLNYYCDAARGESTASVTETVEQTYAAATAGTGGSPAPLPTATGASDSDGSDGAGGNSDNSDNNSSSSNSNGGSSDNNDSSGGGGTNIGAIAGGVAAGAGVVLLGVLITWLIMRRRKKARLAAAGAAATTTDPALAGGSPPVAGKPELSGASVPAPPHSPNASAYKEGTIYTDTVSPISPYGQAPPPHFSELHGQGGVPLPPEMQGTQQAPPSELQSPHQWGQGYPVPGQQYGQTLPLPPELQGQQPQQYGQYAPPQGQPQHPGYGWQAGPYASELGSEQQRR